jgi:hypothetical protein
MTVWYLICALLHAVITSEGSIHLTVVSQFNKFIVLHDNEKGVPDHTVILEDNIQEKVIPSGNTSSI